MPTKLKVYQIGESDKAYHISLTPAERAPVTVWIPKSIVEHISREPQADHNDYQPCVFTLPDWFIKKAGL